MLKSLALAAAVAVVLTTASPAPAATTRAADDPWTPGNCPQGVLCIWPDFNPWGTPSLVTSADWSGNVTGLYFYNRTSRSVDILYTFKTDPSGRTYERCANPGGGDLYVHGNVTKVSFRAGACNW
ncbi:hypothetical protein O7606_02240 [Micromonospora sp. WMMD882]|uniref:hypothetical protein n=1 Tax=Micromonospora sp. WMMD882 TaxID=3015151 RepID=UPI00248CBC1A|nr:hypothetical protein [Micromonospora sp. WMMD882]WBB80228.1 hypothetical protein O7606_02240 [Micromonospora sp. WMMD882]